MAEEEKSPEVPEVFCKKENKHVPIWYCLGSFMQQKLPCPHLEEATVNFKRNYAVVKCNPPKDAEDAADMPR